MDDRQLRLKRETLPDRVYGEHEQRITALERREDEDFIKVGGFDANDDDTHEDSPAFVNSWAHAGAPFASAGFRMTTTKKVMLRGGIKGGALGTVVFVLPEDYRPASQQRFIIAADSSGNLNLDGIIFDLQ